MRGALPFVLTANAMRYRPRQNEVMGFSLCFGGKDFDTLFAFGADKTWKRTVKLHGIGAFSTWMPVHGSKL